MNGSPYDDERISAYLDGELSSEELAAFEKLLSERQDYRQAVDELRQTSNSVRSLPREKLPEDFANRVLRRAEQEMLVGGTSGKRSPSNVPPRDTASWTRRMFWPIAAVAASLLLFLFGPNLSPTKTNVAGRPKANTRDAKTSEAEALLKRVQEKQVDDERDDQGLAEYAIPTAEANSRGATAPPESKKVPALNYLDPEAGSEQLGALSQQPSQPRPSQLTKDSSQDSDADMLMDSIAPAAAPLVDMPAAEAAITDDLSIAEEATLAELPSATAGVRYVSNEDYDAVTNVRTGIRDFYQTLANNQIQFDQGLLEENLVRQETQGNADYFAKQESNDDATVELVLVEAKPEKLQKVVTALSENSNLGFIVSNPNSRAKEQIQNDFANVVAATPQLVEEQALMMQNVQRRPTTRFRKAVPLVTTHSFGDKREGPSVGCTAICLGKVPQQAANGKEMTQLSLWAEQNSKGLALKAKLAATPNTTAQSARQLNRSLNATPARRKDSELQRRLAESAPTSPPAKSEKSKGVPSEQKERVRMLFLIQEPEVVSQVRNEEK